MLMCFGLSAVSCRQGSFQRGRSDKREKENEREYRLKKSHGKDKLVDTRSDLTSNDRCNYRRMNIARCAKDREKRKSFF